MNLIDIYFSLIVVYVLCVVKCNSLDTGTVTVAPLTADNPISSKSDENKDLKKVETRFNDPPPEFYKGPSSSSSFNRDRYDAYDLKYNGGSQRPINLGGSGHINPYLSKHGFYGTAGSKDRISVGGGYYNSNDYAGNGYSNERGRPYGPPQAVDIPDSYNSHHGFGQSGSGYDASYESQGLDWGHSAYGSGGGGGGYGNIWGDKMHYLSKSHFLPLAGAALLGIAAALITNPVLLQLGTVTGKRRRRRRRDTTTQHLPSISAHDLAYNGHQNYNQRKK